MEHEIYEIKTPVWKPRIKNGEVIMDEEEIIELTLSLSSKDIIMLEQKIPKKRDMIMIRKCNIDKVIDILKKLKETEW